MDSRSTTRFDHHLGLDGIGDKDPGAWMSAAGFAQRATQYAQTLAAVTQAHALPRLIAECDRLLGA
jgi:hypothetical protein